MKLSTIKPLNESAAGIKNFVDEYEIESHKVNPDGSINVSGDLTLHGAWDKSWPKINYVDGSFSWLFIPEGAQSIFDYLPRLVHGDCELPITNRAIKSSQLPKSVNGIGSLSLTTQADEDTSTIIVDDNTLSTYGRVNTSVDIVGGFENLPRVWDNASDVMIKAADFTGIPPVIKCSHLKWEGTSTESFKGIHKKIQSIECSGPIYVLFPEGASILGLVKVFNGQDFWPVISGLKPNDPRNQALRKIIKKATDSGTADVLEIQDELIDAGFGKFARL